jgi:acetolactate synthase I/II/III large subunit
MAEDKPDTAEKPLKCEHPPVSRRTFVLGHAAGAGLLAVAASRNSLAKTAEFGIPSITIPADLVESRNAPPVEAAFAGRGMTGAEVFARACRLENLAGLFCCAGNYDVINAIAQEGIPSYGGRTEGSMCAMADGFSRATGEVAAASGTEGPGFTNMITSIAAAHFARTPLLVLASNMTLAGEDREAEIQHMYQQPITVGIKKYGKRLIAPDRVHEYAGHAFRHLKAGIPGPVHLDFVDEVASARFTESSQLKDFYTREQYRSESRPCAAHAEVLRAAQLIDKAQRPLIVAGHGVFQRRAWEELRAVAERNDVAVVDSGPSRGHFGDGHRLSANMAHDALLSADLVIMVGQYCMPSPGEYRFNPDIGMIQVSPVEGEVGRNWPCDLGIVSDEKLFLAALADVIPARKREAWSSELAQARSAFEALNMDFYKKGLAYSKGTGVLHPAVIGHEVHSLLYQGDIDPRQTNVCTGGWTTGLWTFRYLRAFRPAQEIIPAYQYGSIGGDIPQAIGMATAVQRGVGPQKEFKGAPVVCVTSDSNASFGLFELETAVKYRIPTIVVLYNNDCWGVFDSAEHSPRALHLYLYQENLRYDKMAEGLGARGNYVRTPEELRRALREAYKAAVSGNMSTLINCQGKKEFSLPGQYPPGLPPMIEPGRCAFMH